MRAISWRFWCRSAARRHASSNRAFRRASSISGLRPRQPFPLAAGLFDLVERVLAVGVFDPLAQQEPRGLERRVALGGGAPLLLFALVCGDRGAGGLDERAEPAGGLRIDLERAGRGELAPVGVRGGELIARGRGRRVGGKRLDARQDGRDALLMLLERRRLAASASSMAWTIARARLATDLFFARALTLSSVARSSTPPGSRPRGTSRARRRRRPCGRSSSRC